ncbi:hypothetical protein [Rubrivirga sp. IMCC45206]|uniref:hypothetical protein n=1 Tax=Rubrivirga sp. IMCC45206 TaxID=3391614 RepID=UPI00398FED36
MRPLVCALLAVATAALPLAQTVRTVALGPGDLPATYVEGTDTGGGVAWRLLAGDRLTEGQIGTAPLAQVPPALLDVTVAGSNPLTSVFVVCGEAPAVKTMGPSGTVRLDVPEGDCEVGAYRVSDQTLVVRTVRTQAGTPAAVAIDLDTDPEHLVDVTLRDETGGPPAFGDYVQRLVSLTRPGAVPGAGYVTSSLAVLPPADLPPLAFRYSVPDGLDYRIDWSHRSWGTDATRYHYKGRVDTSLDGGPVELGGEDLAALRVRHRPPAGTRPLRIPLTIWSAYPRPGLDPLRVAFTWHVCGADLLAAPFEQTLFETADPAADFFVRPNVISTTIDPGNDVIAPLDPSGTDCLDVAAEEYVAVAPPVRREADGAFRAYRTDIGYGPGVVLGGRLDHALAPLAFTPRLGELGGVPRLILPASPYNLPFHWPGEGVLRGPLATAQAGDARPARMRYEIHDASGALIASGPDAQELFMRVIPQTYPATLTGELVDFGVRVGASPVTVRVALDYGHDPADIGPPHLQQLTVEDGAGPTDTVSPTGRLHVAVADDGTGVDALVVEVRRAESDRPWEPLATTPTGDGRVTAALAALADGAYAVRVRTTDRAGNAATLESDPAFRVTGAVATDEPPAGGLRLDAPRPNPARGAVRLAFALAAPETVDLAVFDVLGRRVATLASGPHGSGAHTVDAATAGLAGGAYVVRLRAGGVSATQPLTVVR